MPPKPTPRARAPQRPAVVRLERAERTEHSRPPWRRASSPRPPPVVRPSSRGSGDPPRAPGRGQRAAPPPPSDGLAGPLPSLDRRTWPGPSVCSPRAQPCCTRRRNTGGPADNCRSARRTCCTARTGGRKGRGREHCDRLGKPPRWSSGRGLDAATDPDHNQSETKRCHPLGGSAPFRAARLFRLLYKPPSRPIGREVLGRLSAKLPASCRRDFAQSPTPPSAMRHWGLTSPRPPVPPDRRAQKPRAPIRRSAHLRTGEGTF